MTNDKIAEIKERHEFISSRTAAFFFPETAWTAHEDRATLLAEVERLTRERDEARAALEPFSELYLWPDDAGRLVAERVRSRENWDEAANDAESNEFGITRGEIRAARRAMEAKP